MARLGKADGRRDSIRAHIVGEFEEERAAVRVALAGVSDPPLEAMELQPHAGIDNAPEPDIALVIFNENAAAPLAYLQAHSGQPRRPLLFALLPERSPALMRSALHAGADELLFMPLEAEDLTRELLKITETRRKRERVAGGRLYSIASLAGGVGVTSLSANLALALHYAMDKSAAVVDLDLQNGALGVYLHLDPEQTMVALSEGARKLDSIRLETALTKHPSGIYLLAAPKRIEDSELISDITIGAVLDLMRQMFDFVVVDCGSRVDENMVAAWERSDEILYVIEQSVIAARTARRFMELFRRLGLRGVEPRLVLNKYESQSPVAPEKIEELAKIPVYARLPRDERMFERLQMRADDLWQTASGSALTRATEALARRLSLRRDPLAEPADGFMTWFLSAIGVRA